MNGWLLLVAGFGPISDIQSALIFPRHHQHNHSSCIVECPNGDLLACWYRGSGERSADDVRIMGSRKRKHAQHWSEPFELADTPGFPDCNPILHMDRHARLWLFWPTILDNHWESAVLKVRWSEDFQHDGPPKWAWQDVVSLKPEGLEPKLLGLLDSVPKEWIKTRPRFEKEVAEWKRRAGDRLSHRLGWMPRVHALELPSGEILVPLYCDTFSIGLCARTTDRGAHWTASGPMVGFGGVQAALARKKDGTLIALQRNNGWGGRMVQSVSRDSGKTWEPNTLTSVPNPGSSVDVVVLASGNWLLIANDTERGRHRISALVSTDEGHSWKVSRVLEEWPAGQGSASYPSVIQSRDGVIHVTYTYQDTMPGKSIKHVWFDESSLNLRNPVPESKPKSP